MTAEWKALWADVKHRMQTIGDPPRLMYFLFVVVGIGGLGAWQASSAALLRENLGTYSMGISAAAAVELVLPATASRALRMLAISLAILAFAAALTYERIGVTQLVWLAAICAWLLWVLSSSSNINIGSSSPFAATGGDTDMIAGDLTAFETEAGS